MRNRENQAGPSGEEVRGIDGADRPAGPRSVATLVVSGPVTLAESPRWRDALLAALADGEDVRIDLATAGPWDLAGLQLLIAALASGRQGGQSVRLIRVPRVFLAIADQAGVGDGLAEAIDSTLDSTWI